MNVVETCRYQQHKAIPTAAAQNMGRAVNRAFGEISAGDKQT